MRMWWCCRQKDGRDCSGLRRSSHSPNGARAAAASLLEVRASHSPLTSHLSRLHATHRPTPPPPPPPNTSPPTPSSSSLYTVSCRFRVVRDCHCYIFFPRLPSRGAPLASFSSGASATAQQQLRVRVPKLAHAISPRRDSLPMECKR